MLYAFDLDDTLADTRPAIELAYTQAGCKPPVGFWGHPREAWLHDTEVYRRKQLIYPTLIKRMVKPLPLVALFKEVGGIILTGASRESATAVIHHLDLQPLEMYCSMTAEKKALRLNEYGKTGIYFDDYLPTCKIIEEKTSWQVVHVLRPS